MAKSKTAPRRLTSSTPVGTPTVKTLASSAEITKLNIVSIFNFQREVERSLKESIEEIRFDILRREDIFVGLTFWQRVMFLLRGRL